MTHSLYLLTAAWIAAQGGDAPPAAPQARPGSVSVPQQAMPMKAMQPERMPSTSTTVTERRGLLPKLGQWLGGLFGRSSSSTASSTMNGKTMQQGNAGMPQANRVPVVEAQKSPIARTNHTVQQSGMPVSKKFEDKIGHEDDYSWVTGQLMRVQNGNNATWMVRYATPETEDRYGGLVVLSTTPNMSNYREGDLVSVRGEILDGGRTVRNLGGALYRVTAIDVIERGN